MKYVNRWEREPGSAGGYYSYKAAKGLDNVSGYDLVARGNLYHSKSGKTDATEVHNYFHAGRQGRLTVVFNGESLTVRTAAAEDVKFDISGLVRKLRKQKLSDIPLADLGLLTLAGRSRNGRLQAKVVLKNIHGNVNKGHQYSTTSVHYVLMIRFQG